VIFVDIPVQYGSANAAMRLGSSRRSGFEKQEYALCGVTVRVVTSPDLVDEIIAGGSPAKGALAPKPFSVRSMASLMFRAASQ
jgi:hypothetical protein